MFSDQFPKPTINLLYFLSVYPQGLRRPYIKKFTQILYVRLSLNYVNTIKFCLKPDNENRYIS